MSTLDSSVWGQIFDLPPDDERIQRIVGVRLCAVTEDEDGEVWLTGLGGGSGYTWQPGWNTAHCITADRGGRVRSPRTHKAPQATCHCGLYGVTNLRELRRIVGKTSFQGEVVLVGVVAEGDIVVHENGWRAEYARVVLVSDALPGRFILNAQGGLIRMTTLRRMDEYVAAHIARKYGARLCSVSECESLLRDFK
jgi:hypothetical protein